MVEKINFEIKQSLEHNGARSKVNAKNQESGLEEE